MPISKINPICELDNFDCIVEAKCNRINCDLTRLGKASEEHNASRVPHEGEKHGWFASNRSPANKKLVITATGPFVATDDTNGRVKTLVSILKSCLELAHDKGCASIKIPMLSSLVYVEDGNRIKPAVLSPVDLFLYHDAASVLSDEYDLEVFLGYDLGISNRVLGFTNHSDLDDDGDASLFPAFSGKKTLVYAPDHLEGETTMCTAKSFNTEINQDSLEKISKFIDRSFFSDPDEAVAPRPGSLDHALINREHSFHDLFWNHIRRLDIDNTTVYSRIYMDRRLFSKVTRKGYHPSKNTAIALAIALRLTYEETIELLASAGYCLSPSYKPDIVITFFIQNNHYDILNINSALYNRKLPLLAMTEERYEELMATRG